MLQANIMPTNKIHNIIIETCLNSEINKQVIMEKYKREDTEKYNQLCSILNNSCKKISLKNTTMKEIDTIE